MSSVLFVCTANRFRSPVAAAAFIRLLEQKGCRRDWQVDSAGTWTSAGQPPIQSALQAAAAIGLDVSRSRSQPLGSAVLERSDLVLVMESGQKEAILSEFPSAAGRVHLLSEMAGEGSYDVPDPVGVPSQGSPQEIVEEIDALIRKGFERICLLAGQGSREGR